MANAARRLPEADGGTLMMKSLRAFNDHFFQCSLCQQHFAKVGISVCGVAQVGLWGKGSC